MDTQTAGIGHNSGIAIFDEANERIDVANRWITERPQIEDAEQADKAGGFKKQLSETKKALDAARREEKAPHDLAAKEVDAKFKPVIDLVDRALAAITAKLTAYLQAEQRKADEERRQREAEAKRKIDEAAAAQRKAEEEARRAGGDALRAQAAADAAGKAAADAVRAASEPARATVKGDFTTRAMSLRTIWRARIVDEKAALKHYAKHPAVRAAALEKIRELAEAEARTRKGEHPPEGIEFYPDQKAA